MKRLLSLCLLTSISTLTFAQSNATSYASLSDELEIMSGVMNTAFRQNANPKGWRVSRLESSYLAGQGAVFTVSVRGKSADWIHDIETMVEGMPTPPAAPVAPEGGGIVFELSREWEDFAGEASRRIAEVFEDNNDQIRDIRSRSRELAWETRELERRKRDMSFELRQADDDRKEALEKEMQELESSLASISAQSAELEEEVRQLEGERQAKLAKQKESRQQAYRSFLANFEASIGSTFCRFGAGLRGLPEGEHVSMILKDFEYGDDNNKHDRIYVFSKANIKACVQERIDAEALLTSATIYTF
ncbi:hypothetical protein [Alteromonas naphthalenivorans]|uniref:Uncharacterized protein n=1 Tax=Alteromonas naphthalenivorans TaxID=715451 RepID=F5Z4P1_ALTNA|nr:hypothetical protein [Alteromonas naphthalenivorans]AEF04378.1 hypothetical protein ambt_14320 [Alteromonas naphthalenivorans]